MSDTKRTLQKKCCLQVFRSTIERTKILSTISCQGLVFIFKTEGREGDSEGKHEGRREERLKGRNTKKFSVLNLFSH